MFLDIDKKNPGSVAIRDDSGNVMTYGELCGFIKNFESLLLPRCVVFSLCENSLASLAGFTAFESNSQVPLMLGSALDGELLGELDRTYAPSYYWAPDTRSDISGETVYSAFGYKLIKTAHEPYELNGQLSMLLTTSGSTGSPKLVRHKYGNIEANAENVAAVFDWKESDRGICDLPMNYTMGLNVINSHLYAGASVLLMKRNLMDPEFWKYVRENGGTDFCGVPFSYEIMRRIGFDKMDLPELKTLAQGGGKLTDKMFVWLANHCAESGRRFYATFGTSETSARMAYLAPTLATEKTGSIGKAIPHGELFLLDEEDSGDGFYSGELGYRGPNVTMGYAVCREDLKKGDDFCGEYMTGDIAKRDADGFYYIIGRKKRFLKLFGLRVGLDETERILKTRFGGEFVCSGDDKKMCIFTTDAALKDEIIPFISDKTKLHSSAFRVMVIDEIPRNEYGKIKLAELDSLAGINR